MLNALQRMVFKAIYRVYLWSTRSRTESGLSSRIVEYPFVLKTLSKKVSTEGRCLVVGCSGDPLTTIIPALGYETYALDIKFTPVKYPHLKFVQADIQETNFLDNWFDVVVAVSTVEHVGMHKGDREGDKKAVKEMMRILKPEGTMLVTIPIASRFKAKTLERIYDLPSLNTLLRELIIRQITFYRRNKDGYWIKCGAEELPNPDNGAATALVVAMKSK